MFNKPQIAPSILSADPLNLERDMLALSGADPAPEWWHIDVMDGHFVPNLTIGPAFVKALKQITDIPLDVHLMIDNPANQLDWYLDAGADLVTIHLETADPGASSKAKAKDSSASIEHLDQEVKQEVKETSLHFKNQGSSATIEHLDQLAISALFQIIANIHSSGALAGISINPGTDVALLRPFYNQIDLVLLMSVHPGFGGQSFIQDSLVRLDQIVTDAKAAGAAPLLEIDGGINVQTAALAVAHGADILVAGNAVFGQPEPIAALNAIRDGIFSHKALNPND